MYRKQTNNYIDIRTKTFIKYKCFACYGQSWAVNTFLYLNTKYFSQMYLNTKYIDVFKYFLFKYFCKYFFYIIFKISSLFIQSIINLKMNEILDIK